MLAQSDGTNRIYFQYNGDNPIGFELNETQYYYVTNTNGDIVGITDANGNLIATYTYDEWGKLLSIIPTDNENEDNAEAQLSIAEINPLRYRGYYYDNETGMYYLQSRYYNPDLCRFISADSFDYINTDTPMSVNAYTYCINNPLIYSDSTGYDFTWDAIIKIIESCLVIDFAFPEFRYVPRTQHHSSNIVSEAGKVVGIAISEMFTCLDLQEIAKQLKIDFTFNNLEEYLQQKVNLYNAAFDKGIIKYWTSANESASSAAGKISTISGLFDKVLPKNISIGITLLPYFTNIIDDTSGRYISPTGTLIMLLFDGLTNGVIDISSAFISSVATPIAGVSASLLFNRLLDKLDTRNKAEYIAYNWYYLLFV